MKIKSVAIYRTAFPFRQVFEHSLARRERSEGIIVRVEASNGITGYGEGLPRVYVTGETQDSVVKRISKEYVDRFLKEDYEDASHVFRVFSEFTPLRERGGGEFPGAALCAVETAMLDLYGKAENKPLYSIFGKKKRDSVRYSAVVSRGSTGQFIRSLLKMRLYGFKQVKVKVRDREDVERVRYARKIMGRSCDLRVDANLAWDMNAALDYAHQLEKSRVSCVEEPLKENSLQNLLHLQEQTKVSLIVDETLCSLEDGVNLMRGGFKGIFNLRLSKCGGTAQGVKLLQLAMDYGVQCMLGCQVGETAILSAAGRHFAVTHPALIFLEGSYGKHILREDVSPDRTGFGYAGQAPAINGKGLGIAVDEGRIERHCELAYTTSL